MNSLDALEIRRQLQEDLIDLAEAQAQDLYGCDLDRLEIGRAHV